MKTQVFKMIAQSCIDAVYEQMDYLKHHIDSFPEAEENSFKKTFFNLEKDLDSLIMQYNDLDTIGDVNWDEAINTFKVSNDNLYEKLNQFSIKII
jgi:hypothetical protein